MVEMLQLVVVGALIFAAFYHFAFHGIVGSGRAHLWFGLTAALMALRNFLFEPLGTNLVPLIGQDWVWRADIAATALCLPAAYWFLALSFRRHLSRLVGIALTASCGAGALVSLIGGAAVGDSVLKAVEIQAVGVIIYLTQAIVRSAWEREKGASLALLGWILVSAAVIHDTLVDNQLISGGNALPIGCVAFFLCLSGALSARSHAAFEKVEKLSAEMKSLNAHLETVVEERTAELSQKILELEAQLIALEQSRMAAVAASETKSRFLANMSHELRTPLNAILGFSEIIRNRIFGEQTERYAAYAGDIHASGHRLLSLIDDILDLSKIEAGKFELSEARLDLDVQIREAIRLVEARAMEKSIDLAFETAVALEIIADERALQQILVNLLTNAVKFTRGGGAIRVCALRNAAGSTTIVIEDTGIGIKPEDMTRVLQSFGQGRHDVAATNERGTGLGLPIVKGLVEAHGGTFQIESTIGVGTKAILTFPPERAVPKNNPLQAA
jgi:signal transduction histidine kinase